MITNKTVNKDIKEYSLLSDIDQSLLCQLHVLEANGQQYFIAQNNRVPAQPVHKVLEFANQVKESLKI
jgi:hypothetical protein